MDVLGLLPGPALKTNAGACDLLNGEAFAYAVSGSVAVVDVRCSPDSGMAWRRCFVVTACTTLRKEGQRLRNCWHAHRYGGCSSHASYRGRTGAAP